MDVTYRGDAGVGVRIGAHLLHLIALAFDRGPPHQMNDHAPQTVALCAVTVSFSHPCAGTGAPPAVPCVRRGSWRYAVHIGGSVLAWSIAATLLMFVVVKIRAGGARRVRGRAGRYPMDRDAGSTPRRGAGGLWPWWSIYLISSRMPALAVYCCIGRAGDRRHCDLI